MADRPRKPSGNGGVRPNGAGSGTHGPNGRAARDHETGASFNLLAVLLRNAPLDRPAIVDARVGELTYHDLFARSAKLATALSAVGLERGDRVSMFLEKSVEAIDLVHACFRLGLVVHPMNTAFTDPEIAYFLEDAEPRVLVSGSKDMVRLAPLAARAGVRLETVDPGGGGTLQERVIGEGSIDAVRPALPEDTAAILYTSGTTGRPKGAMITHGNLVHGADALAEVWGLGPDDRLVHALPLFHAHGLFTSLNTMFAAGASTVLLPRFDVDAMVAALPEATVLMGVPTYYGRLVADPRLGEAARGLVLAISGSAPLSAEVATAFEARTGVPVIERYGLTEAGIITAVPRGARDQRGAVGRALPEVHVRVRAEDGSLARQGTGVVECRGPNVFRGYWRRADADLEAFTDDGWFVTGDIAEIDARGVVRLLGRARDLIITGGLNVYPKEIEDVLDAAPGVAASAVFGVAHADFGEAVVAVVETQSGPAATDGFDEAAVIAFAREKLAGYKTPKRVIAIDEIPRNRLGKVQKNVLRERYASLFDAP